MGIKLKNKKVKSNRVTNVCLVVDRSGSMSPFVRNVEDLVNKAFSDIKKNSFEAGEKVRFNITLFDDTIDYIRSGVLSKGSKLNFNFVPRGMTRLNDAVIESADNLLRDVDPNEDNAYLLIVITDGQENRSRRSKYDLSDKIKQLQATDLWTITFQCPPGDKFYLKHLGIPEYNIREWEQTEKGFEEVSDTINVGTAHYFSSRAGGQSCVRNFYAVPDLSGVDNKKLDKKLNDVSKDFKLLNVETEKQIRDFVEEKTKKSYKMGTVFYQLMKNETVQPTKEVLVMDKTSKHIWGGNEARKLIGLPENMYSKICPGNHANYEIFIQSTSVNRKLPRGTKVLVRK